MITNKAFQDVLKKYPDDYTVEFDASLGWEFSSVIQDPHLYVNSDFGFLRMEPEEYTSPWHIGTETPATPGSPLCICIEDSGLQYRMGFYSDKINKYWLKERAFSPEEIVAWMYIPKYEKENE